MSCSQHRLGCKMPVWQQWVALGRIPDARLLGVTATITDRATAVRTSRGGSGTAILVPPPSSHDFRREGRAAFQDVRAPRIRAGTATPITCVLAMAPQVVSRSGRERRKAPPLAGLTATDTWSSSWMGDGSWSIGSSSRGGSGAPSGGMKPFIIGTASQMTTGPRTSNSGFAPNPLGNVWKMFSRGRTKSSPATDDLRTGNTGWVAK